jgi:tRNA (cmo5U34)-methyltransferase
MSRSIFVLFFSHRIGKMQNMSTEKPSLSYFDQYAAVWDSNPVRVQLNRTLSNLIIERLEPNENQDLLDFGAGTGLVTLALAPYVRKITAVDSSESMISQLQEKMSKIDENIIETITCDLTRESLENRQFDLIISTMTIHHIEDVFALFRKFYHLLNLGGMIAIADLDPENGDFHAGVNAGVFHDGFDRKALEKTLKFAGFSEIKMEKATSLKKPVPEKGIKEFSIFLATAKKNH